MPFKSMLTELMADVPGASGVILADWEGEAVEQCCLCDDDYELKILAAHKGIILNQMKELHVQLAMGDLTEVVITTAEQHVLIGAVGPEYALVMTLERNAIIGPALYRFRRMVSTLQEEIY